MARDPHLRARSGDRNAAISAIQTAYAQGLIGDADRTLRVANAQQAATVGELDLLIRDLVPDAAATTAASTTGAPTTGTPTTSTPTASTPTASTPTASTPTTTPPTAGQPWPTYTPPTRPVPTNVSRPYAGSAPRKSGSSAQLGVALAAVMFVLVTGASGLIALAGGDADSGSDGNVFGEPDFGDPDFDDPDFGGPEVDDEFYELSAPGVDAFISLIEGELGTTSVMRAVFYPDYVSVDVPTDDGKRRQQSWLYRDGAFTQLGEPRASTAGDQPVDLRELSLDGLQVSLDNAVHSLGVEDPTTTYAIVSHSWAEPQGTVSVHVANEFTESAHLTTDFEGNELRRFPFER